MKILHLEERLFDFIELESYLRHYTSVDNKQEAQYLFDNGYGVNIVCHVDMVLQWVITPLYHFNREVRPAITLPLTKGQTVESLLDYLTTIKNLPDMTQEILANIIDIQSKAFKYFYMATNEKHIFFNLSVDKYLVRYYLKDITNNSTGYSLDFSKDSLSGVIVNVSLGFKTSYVDHYRENSIFNTQTYSTHNGEKIYSEPKSFESLSGVKNYLVNQYNKGL